MNKILRFSLVAALALVSSISFAQTTVTFIGGTDKGNIDDAGSHGADQVTKDGITIATTDGLFGYTSNNKPGGEYRTYKTSTFTVSSTVGNITKITVTCSAKGKIKYGPGCLINPTSGSYTFDTNGYTGTWTGEASSVSFSATFNQARMTKIEVTYTPGAVTPGPVVPVTPPAPADTLKLTVTEAMQKVSNDHAFKQNVCVTGIVSKIDEVSEKYGNASYYISADGTEDDQLQVYRGRFLGNTKFTKADQLKVGDKVTIYGELMFYSQKNVIQVSKSHIMEINGQTTGIKNVENNMKSNAETYNMAGQRVGKNYKGVVIKNGKKYMNR